MELKIFWTDTARDQLEDIFEFHKDVAGLKIARKLVKKLIDRTIQLENNPRSGPIEPLLAGRAFEYRSLVEGNYKIIYMIDVNYVYISSVFDCRQNPEKMNGI